MTAVQPRQGQTVLFCMAPALVGGGHFKRELCQSACSSAICLIRRRRQICGSTCRASAYPRLSSCPWTGRRAARAASPSWTTRIARSPRRRSSGSTSNRSREGAWRSARRGLARTVRRAPRAPAASAARGPGGLRRHAADRRAPAATARRPGRAVSAARVRATAAAPARAARRTSAPTPRRSTSASRTRTAASRVPSRSRSVRSAVSTRTTRTGAPRTRTRSIIDNIATHKDADEVDVEVDDGADKDE